MSVLGFVGRSFGYVLDSLWPAPAVQHANHLADFEAMIEVLEPRCGTCHQELDADGECAWERLVEAAAPTGTASSEEADVDYAEIALFDCPPSVRMLALGVDCGFCGAPVGDPCLLDGQPMPILMPGQGDVHPSRIQKSREAAATTPAVESAAVEAPPQTPPAADLTWEGWAVPAICEVLAEHEYRFGYDTNCDCGHLGIFDNADWLEHIAPLIATRISCDPARAIAALQHSFQQ